MPCAHTVLKQSYFYVQKKYMQRMYGKTRRLYFFGATLQSVYFFSKTVFCGNESCRNHERNTWFLPKPLPSGKVTLIAAFGEFGLQFALCSAIRGVL